MCKKFTNNYETLLFTENNKLKFKHSSGGYIGFEGGVQTIVLMEMSGMVVIPSLSMTLTWKFGRLTISRF